MKIAVIGLRGFPNVQGGVETHCENLYPRIAQNGNDVTVFARSSYVKTSQSYEYKGCRIVPVWHVRTVGIEAALHTVVSIFKAMRQKPDVVHIHAIGPALLAPLARMLGMKVVITHHGMDYNRAKWGLLVRTLLRAGEFLGVVGSHSVISISSQITQHVHSLYSHRKVYQIPNGVVLPRLETAQPATACFQKLGLQGKRYVFALGRFVPEKGFDKLIEAWKSLPEGTCELVIAGDADQPSPYSENLKRMAQEAGVHLTGFIKGAFLHDLFRFAHTFVIPSSHEGLPIALLEAMSYDLRVIASDIGPHLEMELESSCYYSQASSKELAARLQASLASEVKGDYRELVARKYNWDFIARQTESVYRDVAHFYVEPVLVRSIT